MLVMDDLGRLPLEFGRTDRIGSRQKIQHGPLDRPRLVGDERGGCSAVQPRQRPGHMALFGYDLLETLIGRGVLEAMGTSFPLTAFGVGTKRHLGRI